MKKDPFCLGDGRYATDKSVMDANAATAGLAAISTPDGVQTVSVRERWKWGDCFVVVARRKTADERTPALARS